MMISERLRLTGGRTTGFDYIRIILAISVVLSHGAIISYGRGAGTTRHYMPWDIAVLYILPMFFALSGFLVSGSLGRCKTLVTFFGLRFLRIVPALAMEVTLSALIFGPLLTSRSMSDYFADPQLRSYFLNIIGYIHYTLPGLFENNPHPLIVNNQLWTIPSELQCYLVFGGLAIVGLLKSRWIVLAIALIGQGIWVHHEMITVVGQEIRAPIASGPMLIVSFLCGALLHLFGERIQLKLSSFLLCALISLVLACMPNGGVYLAFPTAYMTVYLGLLNPRSNQFLKSGDYSYGIYLYGYPIQQAIASIGSWTHHWWLNVGLALPTSLAVAYFSWHFVEKPALLARRYLPGLEGQILGRLSRTRTPRKDLQWRWLKVWLPRVVPLGAQIVLISGILLIINGNEGVGEVSIIVSFLISVATNYFASGAHDDSIVSAAESV